MKLHILITKEIHLNISIYEMKSGIYMLLVIFLLEKTIFAVTFFWNLDFFSNGSLGLGHSKKQNSSHKTKILLTK